MIIRRMLIIRSSLRTKQRNILVVQPEPVNMMQYQLRISVRELSARSFLHFAIFGCQNAEFIISFKNDIVMPGLVSPYYLILI